MKLLLGGRLKGLTTMLFVPFPAGLSDLESVQLQGDGPTVVVVFLAGLVAHTPVEVAHTVGHLSLGGGAPLLLLLPDLGA